MTRVAVTVLALIYSLVAAPVVSGAAPCRELRRMEAWTGLPTPGDPSLAPIQKWYLASPAQRAQLRPDEATIREHLMPLLKSSDAPIRHWAVFMLEQLEEPAAAGWLLELLEAERDEAIVITALSALSYRYHDPRVVPLLAHFMACDGTAAQRVATRCALFVPDDRLVEPALRIWPLGPRHETRGDILGLGARVRDPRFIAIGIETLQTSPDAYTRNIALDALTKWREDDVRLWLEAFYPETTGWNDAHRLDYVRAMLTAYGDDAREFVEDAFVAAGDCGGLRAGIGRLAVQYELGQHPFSRKLEPKDAVNALLTPRNGIYLDAAGDWGGMWGFFLEPVRQYEATISRAAALDLWLRLDAIVPRESRMRTAPLWNASVAARSDEVHSPELAAQLLRSAVQLDPESRSLREELEKAEDAAKRLRAGQGLSLALETGVLTIRNGSEELVLLPRESKGELLILADELRDGVIVRSSAVTLGKRGHAEIRLDTRGEAKLAIKPPMCVEGTHIGVRLFAYGGGARWSGALMSEPVPCGAR